jgi:hypothetical protein
MDDYGFSVILDWRNDNYGWIKDDNINGCNEKNMRYKERNDWKTNLLAIDMIIIKHILEWGKFMRWVCDYRKDHLCGATAATWEHK